MRAITLFWFLGARTPAEHQHALHLGSQRRRSHWRQLLFSATETASATNTLHLPQLLTVADVARLLCLHEKTVYAWFSRGSIPHIRLGRRVLFSPADIGRWLGA